MTFLAIFTERPEHWLEKIRETDLSIKLFKEPLESFTAIIGGEDWISKRESFFYHTPADLEYFEDGNSSSPLPIITIKLKERSALIARDFLGFHPLYVAKDQGIIFSSQKTLLWNLGYEPKEVKPSEVLEIRSPGRIFNRNRRYIPPISRTNKENYERNWGKRIFEILKTTISKCLRKIKSRKVALAFSGGVDSSLIALATSEVVDNKTFLITVGTENSHDRITARKSYQQLRENHNLQHIEIELTKKRVKENLSKIVKRIESSNPLLLEIALPFYFIKKKMETIRADVCLAGQGADELFFGYHKYVRANNNEERLKIEQKIMKNMAKRNLCRDFKVFYPIPVLFPFLSKAMISLAAEIAPKYKIGVDIRKKPIRQALKELGHFNLAKKKKKALQYGSGAKEILTAIAKQRGLSGLTELAEEEFERTLQK